MNARVLVVEDDEGLGLVLVGLLAQAKMRAEHVTTAEAGLEALGTGRFDAVLTDLRLPGMDGIALLREVKRRWSDIPVVMLTAQGSVNSAVEAMRAGAADYLLKPFEREQVLYTLSSAIEARRPNAERPPEQPEDPIALARGLAGLSFIAEDVARAARSSAHVLLRGESGTGKEVVARRIHEASARAKGPFVPVHCGALPDALLESELFGYHKGAFTGATHDKPGRVAVAEGGTLFLDEIGDISPAVQVKLLRLVQEKEYQPLGAPQCIKADVRFLAATHRDLESMIGKGEFREDLFYRLNVIPIWLPPLRERPDDIAPLVERFLVKYTSERAGDVPRLTSAALAALHAHDWPGNVRELENIIERLLVFTDGPILDRADVERELARRGPRTGAIASAASPSSVTLEEHREAAEKRAIEEALSRAAGNRTKAARLLGVSRRTFYNRLEALGLSGPGGRT